MSNTTTVIVPEPAPGLAAGGAPAIDVPLMPIPCPPQRELDAWPWRNPSQWQTWGPRDIAGAPTSFAHLWPFDMCLVRAARGDLPPMAVDIRVVFDCHGATEEFKHSEHAHIAEASMFWTDIGGHRRVFHAGRYALSKDLPAMIQGLTNGQTKCYGAKSNNYMIWKPQGGAGLAGPHYQVFFDLYRTNEPQPRLVMYIQSAYLKDTPLGVQRENVKVFAMLCSSLMGLVPKKTKGKQKIKRRDR